MRASQKAGEGGEIDSLWRCYWIDRGDRLERNRVVEFYYPLVSQVVRRVTRRSPRIADRDLVESAAALGLLVAVERFDPERGTQFPDFASAVMRNQVRRELQRQRSMQACCQSLDEERLKGERFRFRRPCDARMEAAVPAFLGQLEQVASAGLVDKGMKSNRLQPSDRPKRRDRRESSGRQGQSNQPGFSSPLGKQVEHANLKDSGGPARPESSWQPRQIGRPRHSGHSGQPGEAASHATIVEAYYELEPRVRAMLYLHFAEGLTHAEIAESFGISRPRVTQLLGEAVRRLTG